MFWEEYWPYIIAGIVFAALMIGLLFAELLVVRANRRLIRESTKELTDLLAKSGKPEDARRFAKAVNDALEDQRQQVLGRLRRGRHLHRRR